MLRSRERSDAYAIRYVLDGRTDAFDALVRRYQRAVEAVAFAQTGNRADAEDAAQETFLKAFRSLGQLRRQSRFGPWLLAIARNTAKTLAASRSREARILESAEPAAQAAAPDVLRREARALVRARVLELDETLREAVLLHYFAGKSTREIGALLRVSRDAVKKRLERARTALGSRLLDDMRPGAASERQVEERRARIMGLIASARPDWTAGAAGAAKAAGTLLAKLLTATAALVAAGTFVAYVVTSRLGETSPSTPQAPGMAHAVGASEPQGGPPIRSAATARHAGGVLSDAETPAPRRQDSPAGGAAATPLPSGDGTAPGRPASRSPEPGLGLKGDFAAITGVVTDVAGEGVRDAEVFALRASDWALVETTRSLIGGAFLVPLREGGDAVLLYARKAPLVTREPVTAKPGDGQVVLTMAPGSVLTGRLLNTDNEPCVGWTVIAQGLPADTIARTDGRGEFALAGLPQGDYTVVASSPSGWTRQRLSAVSVDGRERIDLGERTVAGDRRDHEDMAELTLDLPRPMFVGTPRNIPSKHLDPTTGKRRAPFWAPVGTRNVALGKDVRASDEEPIIGDISMLTDGDKEGSDGSLVELGPGLQWVQIDLEESHEIFAILVWHYHSQARVYRDVIVQIGGAPDFVWQAAVVFNNDYDNSAGLGVGRDYEYIETYEGKLIDARRAQGRYVRLYSNGNSSNDMNHYIEVAVYGRPAERPSSDAGAP